MKSIRLLNDVDEYRKGQILTVNNAQAASLIKDGDAEFYMDHSPEPEPEPQPQPQPEPEPVIDPALSDVALVEVVMIRSGWLECGQKCVAGETVKVPENIARGWGYVGACKRA